VTNSIVRFLNIVFVALLAGVSFGIWIGANPMKLSQSTYLEQQQNLVGSLQTLMVSLVVTATVITLVSAVLQRHDKGTLSLMVLASLFLISCILITKFGNVPIDHEVMSWTTDTMPVEWTAHRDKWWMFHGMRTIVELIALGLVAWTVVRPNKNLTQ